jgi:serine-type D-Ala-D-Ala carboxypeptidase/endopeptidase
MSKRLTGLKNGSAWLLPLVLLLGIVAVIAANFGSASRAIDSSRPRARVATSALPLKQLPKMRLRSGMLTADEVTRIVGPYVKGSPGAVVVGLIDRDRQMIVGWGKDVSGNNAKGDTIFETASVSKAFTGLLMAQMISRGEIKLEQPVDELFPGKLPTYGKDKQKLTLFQLATHSSGLPAWPSNRGQTTSAYHSDDLKRYLSSCTLSMKPGSDVVYSNAGFALLGEALAARAGTTYDGLLQQRIAGPLGMKDTRVGLRAADKSRLARGHQGARAAQSSAPTAGGGADGVRSTANDMLKLLAVCIGNQQKTMGKQFSPSYEHLLVMDDNFDSGLGWFLDINEKTVEKSGRIAGYRSHVVFSPEARVGVVILSAWDQLPAPDLGLDLIGEMMDKQSSIALFSQ